MKKCNNCGYPSLDDYAKKCRCGAIVDNTYFHIIVTIFILSAIESIFITFIGIYSLFNYEINRENAFLYTFFVLYFIQSIICYIYIKNKIKKSGAKITTFTHNEPTVTFKKNENYSSRVVDFKQEAPTQSSNNGSSFLTGVVTGVVINEILDND